MKSQLCNPESSGRAWHWLLYLCFQQLPRWQVDPELWEMLLTGLQDQSGGDGQESGRAAWPRRGGRCASERFITKGKKSQPRKTN